MDPREFERRALESIEPIVSQVRPGQLSLPTPCEGWDLADLLRHMIGQHRGFAAAARLEAANPSIWLEVDLGDDPAATYRAAAKEVVEAYARPDLAEHSIEIFGYGVIPALNTMQMHAVDYLAHGWDVAKTIGVDSTLDTELCEHGMRIALRWPGASFVSGDPFAPHVEVPDDAPIDQRLMAYLGRDPSWGPTA